MLLSLGGLLHDVKCSKRFLSIKYMIDFGQKGLNIMLEHGAN